MAKNKPAQFIARGELDKQTKDIEKLLFDQTTIILNAVDERMEKKFKVNTALILSTVDEKIAKSETRINAKLDKLITTIDKFLKRLIDTEDEFVAMRYDIDRIKKTIKEKLGVNLT